MKYTAYVKAHDEWHPSYVLSVDQGHRISYMVRVSLLQLPTTDEYRVAVWGADDDGMERDFSRHEDQDAALLFMELLRQPVLTKDYLKSKGFVPA